MNFIQKNLLSGIIQKKNKHKILYLVLTKISLLNFFMDFKHKLANFNKNL